jgi:plastocyanin
MKYPNRKTSSCYNQEGMGHAPSLPSRRHFLKKLGMIGTGLLLLPSGQPFESIAQETDTAQTYVVEFKDFFFDPIGLNIKQGDTVIWIDAREGSNTPHTATSYHPMFDKELRTPEEAEPFNTGFFDELNQTYEYTFDVIGLYDYFCIPHEDTGMVGRILCEEATGPAADRPLSEGISAAGQSVIPFLDELLGAPGEVFNVQGRINNVMLPWRLRDRREARERWALLQAEFDALLPQFLERLNEDTTQTFQSALNVYSEAMEGTDMFVALDVGNDLKGLMEQLAYS